MILKDAFRMQNYLDQIIVKAESFLRIADNIVSKKQEHMRSLSNPEAKDETIFVPRQHVFDNENITPNIVIEFIMDLINEKEKLTYAIAETKKEAYIDIDSSISINKIKQRIASTFDYMSKIKANEIETTARGRKFNINGEEVTYTYNVKEVTTIDFDRNKVKALAKRLNTSCDEVSTSIDLLNVTIEVKYTPKYSIGDSFDDCLEIFLEKNK